MKRIVTIGLVAALAAAVAAPRPAAAGEREWATAGKILTGVVVAGMLADVCASRPAHVRSEIVINRPVCVPRPPPPLCRPRATVTMIRPAPRVIVERQIVVCAPPPPPPRAEPIIIYQGDGRRLYQPPVHGHKAFVQIYSELTGEWVSIKERPSMW